MNELIKTFKQKDGSVAVDGRDLHDFLEVETPYRILIQRMIEYGFTENADFIGFEQKSTKPIKSFTGKKSKTSSIQTRSQLREGDFQNVQDYVSNWVPSTATLALIKQLA